MTYDASGYKHGQTVQTTLKAGIEINALFSFVGACLGKPLQSVFILQDYDDCITLQSDLNPLINAYRLVKRQEFIKIKDFTASIAIAVKDEQSKADILDRGLDSVLISPYEILAVQLSISEQVRYQERLMNLAINLANVPNDLIFSPEALTIINTYTTAQGKLKTVLTVLYWLDVFDGIREDNGVICLNLTQEALDWLNTDLIRAERFLGGTTTNRP